MAPNCKNESPSRPASQVIEPPSVQSTWLEPLLPEIAVLRADRDHQERAHESLVERFLELLGYSRFQEIKHRQGRIDIGVSIEGIPAILFEVKRDWNLTKADMSAIRQAYNYAAETGVRFVAVTNGDYYALFDRQNGLSYDANFVGEFTISKLTELNHPLMQFLKKKTMSSVVELISLGASVTLPRFP